MAYRYGRLNPTATQVPPVVSELEALFAAIPDEALLTTLQGPVRRGPKGYDPKTLWRCYVAFYYLGLPSVSDLVRTLHDNPYIAKACGVDGDVPSQPTFSRFMTRLAKLANRKGLRSVMWTLADTLQRTLPDFGKSVSVDSTDIKGWSNGAKHYNGKSSDPDAGWCVKTNTEGNKKFVWGYKAHILTDTTYELPIVVDVTAGNVHDSMRATPVLRQAKYAINSFFPKYFIADSAYSSDKIRKHIHRNYWPHGRCEAIIDPNRSHTKAVARTMKTPEWKAIYNRRTASERVNSRLKACRRLNEVRTRGRFRVYVHVLLSVMVMQAQALATGCRQSVRKVA